MKKITKFLILMILMAGPASALDLAPEDIYQGSSDVAGVETMNALFINPAAMSKPSQHDLAVVFDRPFSFRSLVIGLPLTEKNYLGIGIYSSDPLTQVRFGMSLVDAKFFKWGFAFGPDREAFPGSERFGFALSTGILVPFIQNEKNNFQMTWGLDLRNLVEWNEFLKVEARKFTWFDGETGLRTQLFVPGLNLNLGLGVSDIVHYSVGMEARLFHVLTIGAAVKDSGFGLGAVLQLKHSSFSFGWDLRQTTDNDWAIGYTYYLNAKNPPLKKARKRTGIQLNMSEIVEQQKMLLDEGITNYKNQDYEKAQASWQKCMGLAPETDIAREAKKYNERVKAILNNLK